LPNMPPSSLGFGSAKPLCSKKAFWRGKRLVADTGQRNVILELRTGEKIQEKKELPFLSLEPQVTIIKAVIRKILVA